MARSLMARVQVSRGGSADTVDTGHDPFSQNLSNTEGAT
jgi:hypothetical protein